MRLPPWAIEAIRNGVADVARKASDTETIARVRAQAAELLRDLPENASRSIDALVKTASETARGAIDQGRESMLRWTERHTDLTVPCVNASGVLLTRSGTGVPVSDPVLQLGADVLRGDCVDHDLNQRLSRSLARLLDLDGHAIAVATSLDAAIASLTVLAQQREFAMHRSQAIRLPSGTPLPDALAGLTLRECGGVQAIEPRDFDGIDHACVILADDGVHPIGPIDFKGRDVISVAVLPIGTIRQAHDSIPSAQVLLQSGIDLVLLPGGPLTGGTAAGVLAGKKTLIDSIQQDARWNTHKAAAGIVAMTLAAMTDSNPSPLSVLIDTGVENLRSRAERMAIRLTAVDSITGCQITDRPARLIDGGRWEFPSRQLNLRHKTLSAQQWSDLVAKQNPAVITGIDGEHLVIDLRWLPASADSAVAAALGPGESSPSDAERRDAPQA